MPFNGISSLIHRPVVRFCGRIKQVENPQVEYITQIKNEFKQLSKVCRCKGKFKNRYNNLGQEYRDKDSSLEGENFHPEYAMLDFHSSPLCRPADKPRQQAFFVEIIPFPTTQSKIGLCSPFGIRELFSSYYSQ